MKGIEPDTLLPIGTTVQTPYRYGTVVKAEMVRAHPCGYVAVHTIRYTHKVEHLSINMAHRHNSGKRIRLVPLKKPITQPCNYAFISVVN